MSHFSRRPVLCVSRLACLGGEVQCVVLCSLRRDLPVAASVAEWAAIDGCGGTLQDI